MSLICEAVHLRNAGKGALGLVGPQRRRHVPKGRGSLSGLLPVRSLEG
jgi:hypothetical protein